MDQVVRVWDCDTCKVRVTLEGHTAEVMALAFSPVDPRRLASTSYDRTIRLWDVEQGRLHATAHGNGFSLAFSPDGRRIAARANESNILIDADTGDEIGELQVDGIAFAFSPNGETIAVEDANMQHVHLVPCATADEVKKDLAERRIQRDRQQRDSEIVDTFRKTVLAASIGRLSADERRKAESTLAVLKQTPEYYRAYAPRILLPLAESYASELSGTESDVDRAHEILEDVQRLAVNDEWSWTTIATVHWKLENWSASKAALEKALDADPWPSATSLNRLAWLLATCPLEELRDPKRAVDLARKACDTDPDRPEFRNTLGVALYRQGEWQEAIDTLDSITEEIRPPIRVCNALFIAMSHSKLGNHEEARDSFRNATQISDENNLLLDEELRRFRAEAEALLKSAHSTDQFK